MSNAFGNYLKKLRSDRQLTLRSFCDANDFDPGNYSKIERGILSPPQKLEPYREAFKLAPKSEEWQDLQRLASISRGEIPTKVLGNSMVVEKLPALFRTLENGYISAEKLEKIIATLEEQRID